MSAPPPTQLQYLTPNELAALGEFLARLREKFGDAISHVWLFGSKVRGDFDEESDIDLLVVTEDDSHRNQEIIDGLAVDTNLMHSVLLGHHIVSTQRYEQMLRRREPVYETLQEEGIDLWQAEAVPIT